MPTPDPVTISFLCPEIDAAYYEVLVQEFQKLYPHITVELVPAERANTDAILAAEVDTFSSSAFTIHSLREQDGVLNLEVFIEGDASFNLDDFYPGAMMLFEADGKIWGIPSGVDVAVMYYNQDLFTAYGVPYPDVVWTLEEFLDKAAALRDVDAGIYGYATMPGYPDAVLFVYQRGGRIFDDLEEPTTPTFNDPLTIKALEWYADLFHKHDVALTPEQAQKLFRGGQYAVYDGIRNGQVGMWIGSLSDRGGLTWRVEWMMQWGVVPLPRDARFMTQAWSEGYAISSSTPHVSVCWQWIRFLSERAAIYRLTPARRSVAESDAYREVVGGDVATVARMSMENAVILDPNVFEAFGAEVELFNQAVASIVEDGASPRQAMEQAQQEAEALEP